MATVSANTIESFLLASCPVCLVPHSDEIHQATLRVRRSVLLPPMEEQPERKRTAKVTDIGAVAMGDRSCTICNRTFSSTCIRAKYCATCKPGAVAKKAAKSSKKQAERRKAARNPIHKGIQNER